MTEPNGAAFRRRQRVVAEVDLADVPRGTEGRVMYESGFRWIRYRVQFDNGVERGGLDERHLVSLDEWREHEREEARRAAIEEQRRLAEELRAQVITADGAQGAT